MSRLKSAELLKQVMSDYFARLRVASEASETSEASDDNKSKKIAWCTSVGPAELLWSMGFQVYFPENHAAMIGASKRADEFIPVAVSHGYSPEVCSYLTSDIGSFLKKETPLKKFNFAAVPRPDVLVYNTNQCGDVQNWFSFYAKHFQVPIMGIHTPLRVQEISSATIAFICDEYQRLIAPLEKVASKKFDLDKFKDSVALSHKACTLWKKVLETARNKPAAINFFDATIHMAPVVVMRGTTYAVDYYQALLAELETRVENREGAIANEKHRIYWDGMPLWFKLKDMSELFAKLNTSVVASTYCNSWVFDDLDPVDPFYSSALAYSKLFIVRSDEVKEQTLANLFNDYSINGVIYHDSKTCPRNSNNHYGLHKRLKQNTNIPFLEINGDLNDSRCYSEAQGVTAIETFIQQLEMKR